MWALYTLPTCIHEMTASVKMPKCVIQEGVSTRVQENTQDRNDLLVTDLVPSRKGLHKGMDTRRQVLM